MKKTIAQQALNGRLWLCSAVALTMAGLSSCSDNDLKGGQNDPNAVEEEAFSPVSVVSDQSILSKYVKNYMASRDSRASAADMPAVPTMPEMIAQPTVPEDAKAYDYILYNNYNPYQISESWYTGPQLADLFGNMKIEGDYENQLVPMGQKIYVTGNWKLTAVAGKPWWASDDQIKPVEIYVLPGASLTFPQGIISDMVTVYNWGTINGVAGASAETNLERLTIYSATELTIANPKIQSATIYAYEGITADKINMQKSYSEGATGAVVFSAKEIKANEIMCSSSELNALAGIEANKLTVCNSSTAYVKELIDIDGEMKLDVDTKVYAYTGVYAQNLVINANSILYAPCNVIVDETIKLDAGGDMVTGYVKADKIWLASQAGQRITLFDGGLWETNYLDITNSNGSWVGCDPEEAALVKVAINMCAYDGGWPNLDLTKTFDNVYINCPKFEKYGYDYTGNVDFNASVKLNEAIETQIKDDDSKCANWIFDPTPEPDPIPPLEPVADIDGCHVHPISATCIAVNNNQAYVSWHLRGGNVWGCIEKITLDNDVVTLDAWLETPAYLAYDDGSNAALKYNKGVSGQEIEDIKIADQGNSQSNAYDFNHIIYQDGYLITVGDHDTKGGFIGRIATNVFTENSVDMSSFSAKQLGKEVWNGNTMTELIAGRSGNCVVYNNGQLYVTSRGGYQVYNYSTAEGISKVVSAANSTNNGSVKHLALDNNNQLYTIEYWAPSPKEEWWDDNSTTLPAAIKKWNIASGWDVANDVEPIVNDANFGPVFGKDVIAVDNGKIYSCQGWDGVKVYNAQTGVEEWSFNVIDWIGANSDKVKSNELKALDPSKKSAGANGLCVDEKYLYVANGSAGVWVVDKDTHEVASYYYREGDCPEEEYYDKNTSASANYVQIMKVNGQKYVVVAYGRAGVRVLKLAI